MNEVLAGTQKTKSRKRSPSAPARQPDLHPWAEESQTLNVDSQVDHSQSGGVNPDSLQLAMPPPTGAAGSATPAESATADARAPAESVTAATSVMAANAPPPPHPASNTVSLALASPGAIAALINSPVYTLLPPVSVAPPAVAPAPSTLVEETPPPSLTTTDAVDGPPAEASPNAKVAPAAPGSPVTSAFTGVSLEPNATPAERAAASGIDATQPLASRAAASSGDTQVAIQGPQLQRSDAPPTSTKKASPAVPHEFTSSALGAMLDLLGENADMASTTAPASETPCSTAAGTPRLGLSEKWNDTVAAATKPGDIPRSKDWAYNGPCN